MARSKDFSNNANHRHCARWTRPNSRGRRSDPFGPRCRPWERVKSCIPKSLTSGMCHGLFGGGVSACRGLNEQLRRCKLGRGQVHRICGGRWRKSPATLGNFLRKLMFVYVRQFPTLNRALIEVPGNSKQDASFTWSALPRPSSSLNAVKAGAQVSITVRQNSLGEWAIASIPVDARQGTTRRNNAGLGVPGRLVCAHITGTTPSTEGISRASS